MAVLIVLVFGAFLLLLLETFRPYGTLRSFEPIVHCTRSVNLNHLRLCIDGLEEGAPREHLSPSEFRNVQREGRQVVAEYLGRMMFNVRLFMRYQPQKMNSDGIRGCAMISL
jgi:hypothetical protein